MSGARATSQSVEPLAYEDLDVPQMVDILYDIVATGVETSGSASVAQIEQFLHEHAREPRTLHQFQAFFAEHRIEPPRQTEPRIPLRVIAPLPAPEVAVKPVGDVAAMARAAEAAASIAAAPVLDLDELELTELTPDRNHRMLWALGIAAVALLGLGLGVVISMHQDLEAARTQVATTTQTLELQQVREDQLERELKEDRVLLQQLKQQSDQLVQEARATQATARKK